MKINDNYSRATTLISTSILVSTSFNITEEKGKGTKEVTKRNEKNEKNIITPFLFFK